MGSIFAVLLMSLLLGPKPSFAGHEIVGTPPSFTMEPPENKTIVTASLESSGGVMGNLVLPCGVTGTPTPTIKWFREETELTDNFAVTADGTLVANVTNETAFQTGVPFHCEATNIFGADNSTATIRSRNVNVFYSFFGGFLNTVSRMVSVPAFEGQAVALECDFLPSIPPPTIRWFSDTRNRIDPVEAQNAILYLEGGRYLFIRELTAAQLMGEYHCEAMVSGQTDPVVAPTTYMLNATLPPSINPVEYKQIGNITAAIGARISFVYAASFHMANSMFATLSLDCSLPAKPSLTIGILNRLVGTIDGVPAPTGSDTMFTIDCDVNGASETLRRSGTLFVIQPARITSPTDTIVNDRDRLVGGGSVSYTCTAEGIPPPSVTWYYNGRVTLPSGASAIGNQLTISAPQITHSGIYQCFASNNNGMDSRAWILEVRQPSAPTVRPLSQSNPSTSNDRLVGTLIVSPFGTVNQMIRATLDSDPCPSVQWSLNGTDITNDTTFSVSNPCADSSALPPFNFTLTITNFTSATSGNYFATFNNLAGSVSLPQLFVTVPVPVQVINLTRQTDGPLTPSCLLSGSNITLTCELSGFPRPNVTFVRITDTIHPGAPGFERFTLLNFDQIHLANVMRSDEGDYFCVADAQRARINQVFCTMPRITNLNRTGEAVPVEGQMVTLLCEVEGDPTPVVTWRFNGTVLGDSERIAIASSPGMSRVRILMSRLSDAGLYTCFATNDAATINSTIRLEIQGRFTTAEIVGIAVGGAAGLILIILFLLLILCACCLCCKKSESATFHPYNVDYSAKSDQTDGRGNVDADSDDGVHPEAFNPEYESLPAHRPLEPPPYKATPGYPHGAPMAGDDVEMMKYPPQDAESYVPPYSRQQDNGYRPSADDFISEDAQFV